MEDISTPAGEYSSVFHVESKCSTPERVVEWNLEYARNLGQSGKVDIWIKPGIGVVKMIQSFRPSSNPFDSSVVEITFGWELLR